MVGNPASADEYVIFKSFVGVEFPVIAVTDTNRINMTVKTNDVRTGAHPSHYVTKRVNPCFGEPQLIHFLLDAL